MGIRADLRTRLQALQEPIAGIKKAHLNVPMTVNGYAHPQIVNFFGASTYNSLEGNQSQTRADMPVTMRLYLGAINTVEWADDKADELIPLIEAVFLGNTNLNLNHVPLHGIEFRMLSNSGLVSQQYPVSQGQELPYLAVVEFPCTVSLYLENC